MAKNYTPMLTIFKRRWITERPIYGPRRQVVRPWGHTDEDAEKSFAAVASTKEGAHPYKGRPVFICYDEGACYHVEQGGFILAWFHANSLTGDCCSAVMVWNAILKTVERSKK